MTPILFAVALLVQQPPAGTVVGKVLDAGSGLPVSGVLVTLEPAATGLISDNAALTSARSQLTGENGVYRFGDVVPGTYRLRVERLGYRATTLEIAVRRPVTAHVSVGIEVEPIALEAVRIEQRATALFQRASNRAGELDDARVVSERARQALFIAPDARMLTYADVMDGVTLGEGDVFRALQRFPGVGTRDDYTAELWTRGAPWTHTRVTFDGVPLFNPVHAVGILSAITPEVLGAAFFHPGVRPASVSEGAAGVVELRSRAGGGTGAVRAVTDVSLASAKLVLDQNIAGRAAWIVAARRSHLGVLTNGLDSFGLDTLDLPYSFHDLAGRVDVDLGAHAQLEASGLWEEDRLTGDVEGVLERTRAHWGNSAGRITLRNLIGGVELNNTLGMSRFETRTDERLIRTRAPAPAWTEPASSNEIRYLHIAGQLAPVSKGTAAAAWSLGYDVAWQDISYDGSEPRYYAVKPDTVFRIRYQRELRTIGAWGDGRIALGKHVVLNPGLRVEAGDTFANAGQLRWSPRAALRVTLSEQQTISLAAGRSWQYVQAIGLAGPSIHPAFHASHFWLWADARTPALRSDIASVGTERWLGDGWLLSATFFARRARGLTLPDPAPGLIARRPRFVEGENDAHGVEVGARRIGATWSTSLGYTYGKSQIRARALEYPSPADRRHTVDAMFSVRLVSAVRVAAAYTAMSGAPFTRAYAVTREDCNDFGFGCDNPDGSYVQAPNAQRTPAYHALDASVHATMQLSTVEATAYFQLRNVLNRDNASTYSGSRPISRVQFEDRFEPGLPCLPLLGVRVIF